MVHISQTRNDPYRRYRSRNTEWIVGVTMKLGYLIEAAPTASDTDQPQNDSVRWVKYDYDLEIDANGRLIGGEWYDESHPDFIWTPVDGAVPVSGLESLLMNRWDGLGPVPAEWSSAATAGSEKGILVHEIARTLLERAR